MVRNTFQLEEVSDFNARYHTITSAKTKIPKTETIPMLDSEKSKELREMSATKTNILMKVVVIFKAIVVFEVTRGESKDSYYFFYIFNIYLKNIKESDFNKEIRSKF